jgi:hypothetical protein
MALSVRTAGWQIILHQQDESYWPLYPLQAGTAELYNGRADPAQEHNLWQDPLPAARQARKTLSGLLARWQEHTPTAGGTSASLDEESLELLRKLGY